ncbi:MAG: hypothetical protein AB9834_01035 [Lentimicrobium sp.]
MRQFDKLRFIFPALVLFVIIFYSCAKEKAEPQDAGAIKITSLTTSDTILVAWIDSASILVAVSGNAWLRRRLDTPHFS